MADLPDTLFPNIFRRSGSVTVRRLVLCWVSMLALGGVAPSATAFASASADAASPRPHETAGQRIVSIAKRFVGHAKYHEGGNSPKRGFDCSGYTQYVFRHAGVAHLPHNAQAQRHAHHMRRITEHQARPGDLVFYLDGGNAYHVAIYSGHHMQYAAATPRDGIRHQRIWSSHVEFRTDWH